MGDAGTWTIFVYLCGSDLEVNFGSASADLTEMINSSANDKVKYVVQTGGAASWEMDISSDASERFVIQNGKCERVYSGPDVDMGSSDVLADFLKWGISEYPAANMGLILWDHGSGSINGACFDDNHGGNCLLLKDIDAALYSVYDQMTEPFEFIGFDACLMSTAETAAVMATHARYFIGSQDIEPGSGWNYKNIGDYLAQNPECTGAELGKVVVDSFYSDCAEIGREDGATLAVGDLSKIDTFIEAFDKYAKDVYELTESGADFFVSIHRNSSPTPNQYNGVQTLIYNNAGLKATMAENVNKELEQVGYRNINVVERPDLAVLRRTRMPAILVEAGFIERPSAGIYTRPILNATTEIALASYRESFFLNNPLLSRNNDYDGSPYFEFVR